MVACGAYKGSALVFVSILYLDYSRALILLANFEAQLLLGLSLPFSAIPPAVSCRYVLWCCLEKTLLGARKNSGNAAAAVRTRDLVVPADHTLGKIYSI